MDISKETDIDKLKAMAYDNIILLERAQKNINAIQTRIAILENKKLTKK